MTDYTKEIHDRAAYCDRVGMNDTARMLRQYALLRESAGVSRHVIDGMNAAMSSAPAVTFRPITDGDARAACMANLHPLTEPSSTELRNMRAALESILPHGMPVVTWKR